jgi:transposase
VPWARKGSGFTLLFEAFSMLLIEKEMPVKQVSETLKVYDNRVWRVFNHYVDEAVSKDDLSEITCIGIDETSARKGHKYVTIAVDMKTKRVIHATEGKDAKTIESIAKNLEAKGGDPKAVTQASIDMSPSFIAGIMDNLPEAEITFDKFHISKMLNEAVDDVRKKERREHNELKGHKYLFLKSDKKLTKEQIELREDLMLAFPGLAKAVQLRELFNDFWNMEDMNESQAFLSYWCDLAEESGVEPFRKFVAIIKKHWSGIVNYLKSKITNGILEGINSKIQLAKKRARGYRNTKYFINMIYFIAGKLKLDYPHFST